MDKEELLKMARDAGFEVYKDRKGNMHAWVEGVIVTPDIEALVNAILERAAVECEEAKSTIWEFNDALVIDAGRNTCDNLAKRMRALKTQGE